MAAPTIQFKRGLLANLPALKAGEPGIATNTSDLYIGLDGTLGNNKFFGSHRYWNKETSSTGSSVKLVEGTTNGGNFIALKSPDTLGADTTYTFPATPSAGFILQTDGSGVLSWVSAGAAVGTISTATRATQVDTTTAASGTYYPALLTSSTGVLSATVNVDAGISYVSNTDTLTVQNLTVPGTLTGTATTATRSTVVDTTTAASGTYYPALLSSSTGATSSTVNVDAGISYVSNTDTLTVQNLTVSGTLSGTVTGTISTATRATLTDTTTAPAGTFYPAFHTSGTGVASTATYVDTGISYVSNTDTLTVQNLTVPGTLTGTATTATKINTTTSTATGYIPFVANGTTTAGETLLVDANIQFNGSTDTLIVANAQHSTVKAADGTAAITITNSTGAVGISSDLTVAGNLYVTGSTTQVNTNALTVEDRTIDLGIVNGTTPSSATTWDLGILFNYFDTSAKKSGVIWENANSRFQFANSLTSESASNDVNTPQIVAATFAPIEVGALWLNDTLGQSVVASYLLAAAAPDGVTAGRYLQNITVDAGLF
jgi:hypothetical protein